uniref:C-type lectin domain-containing protein n=1 Tax=Knipowitschia caucasica TaxID=637954 RepID=A0AAV2M3S5_KNICA
MNGYFSHKHSSVDFVINLRTEPKQDLWIGLYKHKGSWTWINDVVVTGYRAWRIGVLPSHAAEGSAAFMVEDGTWNYTKEGHKGYVCELKL